MFVKEEDQEVYYQFGGQGDVWSGVHSFRCIPPVRSAAAAVTADTAPGAAASGVLRANTTAARRREWSFLMIADHGVARREDAARTPGAWEMNRALQALLRNTRGTPVEPRFILHAGDLAYSNGHLFSWELWSHEIEPVALRLPYMVSIGNHDYDHVQGPEHDPSGAGLGYHPPYWVGNPPWGVYGDWSEGECGVPMVTRFLAWA